MKRILIVDSDMAVRGQIGRYARLEGYEVAEAGDGYTAVSMCRQNAFDIIILAILLPEMDGFSVCQTIRSFSQVPILMLTERTSEQDRIRGLELGADDYMTKPFSPRELMLRISAILKRGRALDSIAPQYIEREGIYIDLTARRVMVDGTLVSLTPKEFDLLALLAGHPDVVFSRKSFWTPSGVASCLRIPAPWIPILSKCAMQSNHTATESLHYVGSVTGLKKTDVYLHRLPNVYQEQL